MTARSITGAVLGPDGVRRPVSCIVDVAPARTLLVGASNADTAAELAAYEGRYGLMLLRRSYNQPPDDLPPTWAACAAGMDAGKRASVWSFKPNVPAFGTGAYDPRARTFLASIPADGRPKWLLLEHEPEREIKNGIYTPDQYKAGQARWDGLVKETGRPDLLAAVCFAGTQCFDGQTRRSHGFDADDLAPEGMAVTFDAYNRYPEAGAAWKDLADRAGLQAAWANAGGRRWGISETACYEHPDGPARKVTWTRSAVAWAREQGAGVFTYWDNAFGSDPDKTKRRLHSSPQHIAAWADLAA